MWSIPSQPLQVPARLNVDHFAAFPTELPRRIIAGWSPPGVCTACGQGRRPVIDRKPMPEALKMLPHRTKTSRPARNGNHGPNRSDYEVNISGQEFNRWRAANPEAVTGYACACPDTTAPTRPAVVADPFGGTGTTALVASVLGRIGLSFDLSHDYSRLARWRTQDPGERCRVIGAPKPPPVADGQDALFAL